MLGEGKFLPPKLRLLLQHIVSVSLSNLLPLYALHMEYYDGNKSLYLVFVGVVFFSQHLGLLLEQLGQHLGLLLEQLGQQHLGCFF
jgi:hypothetical protein